MSDFSYWATRHVCYPAFWISSKPLILHLDRAAREGGYVLAPTHLSPFDVPLLVADVPRMIDFMSVVEFKRHRLVHWYFRCFNTFFLDRSRVDVTTMREAVKRLQGGRVVGLFPEGGIRSPANSVLNGGSMKPGIARLAEITGVPVIPCTVLGGEQYLRFKSWLPVRGVRYGLNFGHPIQFRPGGDKAQSRTIFMDDLRTAYQSLAAELTAALGRTSPAIESPTAANEGR